MVNSAAALASAPPLKRLTWLVDGPDPSATPTELRNFLAGLNDLPQDDPGVIGARREGEMALAIAQGQLTHDDLSAAWQAIFPAVKAGRMTYEQAMAQIAARVTQALRGPTGDTSQT